MSRNNPRRLVPRTKRKTTINATLSDMYGKRSPRTQKILVNHRKKTHWSAKFFGILLASALFTGLTWAGIHFFGAPTTFQDANVELSIDTPLEITSGDEITFTVFYKNTQKTELQNAQMRIKPPEGFSLAKSEPASNGNNAYHFTLGTLGENESGKIIIHGTFIGVKDGNQEITAYLSYRPENFNADFETVKSAQIAVSDVPLSAEFTAPDNTQAGAPTMFTLTLKNNSTKNIGPIIARPTFPEVFSITKKEPDFDSEIKIEKLNAQEEITFDVEGTFKNSGKGDNQILVDIFIERDGKKYLQHELIHFITVEEATLEARIMVDDFTKKASVAPGKSFELQATAINNSNSPIENVFMTIMIEEPANNEDGIINWDAVNIPSATITSESLSDKRKRTTITFSPETSETNLQIPAESELIYTIQIPILSAQDFGGILPGNTIIINSNVSVNGGSTTHTPPFEVSLRSDTDLLLATEPASDPIIGVGPDGITEVSVRAHNVQFIVTNTLHEIQEIEVLLFLAEGVIFEKSLEVPAGELQYIQSKNAVRWILNKIPTTIKQIPITFKLDTITPIGDPEPTILLKETELTAIDSVSQEPFKIKLGPLNRK